MTHKWTGIPKSNLNMRKKQREKQNPKLVLVDMKNNSFFFLRSFICLGASSLIKKCNVIMLSSFLANFID